MISQFDSILFFVTQVLQVFIFTIGCYFFCISVFAWRKKKKRDTCNIPPIKSFALVIAAHNEEKVIKHIVESLNMISYPKELFDIFVIADNCSDNTAKIALEHNAIVYERFDEEKRGKGFALDWMFKKIFAMEKKYDAVCIFDADNLVSSNFLIEMNTHLCSGHKVIQGYIDSKNPYDSWISCSYSIAFWLANRLFQLPRYYLGLSCGICGTGFCIDLKLLEKIGWGTTSLTEDLEFTMKLALNGQKVYWSHDAIVYDEKPLTLKQSWKQRVRWMQGHSDCAGKYFLPLFSKAFKESNFVAFDCGMYLFQPVRFIFLGLTTLMMWVQTFYPDSPFFSIQYIFPATAWYILALCQIIYGPLVLFTEKKFNLQLLVGFVLYPLYCLTWLPITIQGVISKDNKTWAHTVHTRDISIKELENA